MTPAEARLQAAIGELAGAIVAVVAETSRPPSVGDPLLSVAEAAAALGLGRSATYDLILRGDLRSLRIGTRRLVPSSAVADLIAAKAAA